MKKALVISLLVTAGLGFAAFAGWHFGFEQSLLGAPTLPWGPPPCEATLGFDWDFPIYKSQTGALTLDGSFANPEVFLIEGDIYLANPDLWAVMPAEWIPGMELYFEWGGFLGLNLESEWLLGFLPSPDYLILKDWTGKGEVLFILSNNATLKVGADIIFVPGPRVSLISNHILLASLPGR